MPFARAPITPARVATTMVTAATGAAAVIAVQCLALALAPALRHAPAIAVIASTTANDDGPDRLPSDGRDGGQVGVGGEPQRAPRGRAGDFDRLEAALREAVPSMLSCLEPPSSAPLLVSITVDGEGRVQRAHAKPLVLGGHDASACAARTATRTVFPAHRLGPVELVVLLARPPAEPTRPRRHVDL